MRLYHNPRCSKSRQALTIMNDSGVEFEEYRYLDLGIANEDLEIISRLENVVRTADITSDVEVDLSSQIEVMELLKNNPKPTESDIRHHLEGNICRCTGYHNIVNSIMAASGQDVTAIAAE